MPHSPQDFHNKILGAAGENKAVRYLKKQGCKILRRNFRTPFGEADIVVQDGEDTVFVEVKTRRSADFSTPGEAVDRNKQRRYRDIARYYLSGEEEEVFIRFDVIEIEDGEINWLKGAFFV